MKKLLIRFAIRWIVGPVNKLQQTHPKVYWSICTALLASQTVIHRQDFTDAVREACSCNPTWIQNIGGYLAVGIAALMGSGKIKIKNP